MSLNLPALWHRRGRHRAADQIPLIEAERDRLAARNAYLQNALGHADALLVRVCQRAEAARGQRDDLQAEYDTLAEAHELLDRDYDELAARFNELQADLANLRTVRSPAPADNQPAIPEPDNETTRELYIPAVWGVWGMDGLRTATAEPPGRAA